jgi:hypothetical protein
VVTNTSFVYAGAGADTRVDISVQAVNPNDTNSASAATQTNTAYLLVAGGDYDGDGIGNQAEINAGGSPIISNVVASVTLSNLVQAYNGTARSATATTTPPGLSVSLSYNGSTNAPTNPGLYNLIGTVTQPGYSGAATNNFVITGPVPVNDTIVNSQGNNFEFQIPLADLLANDARIDATGASVIGGLSVSSVASGSGTAELEAPFVWFTPTGASSDTFSYTVSDGTSSRTATVTVTKGDESAFSITFVRRGEASFNGTNTTITHDFIGVPGQTYTIDFRGEMNQPWDSRGHVSTGATGSFSVTFTKAGNHVADWDGSMFFRAARVTNP